MNKFILVLAISTVASAIGIPGVSQSAVSQYHQSSQSLGVGGIHHGNVGHQSSSSVSNIQHHGIHPLGGISSIGAVNRGISSSSISSLGVGGIHPIGHVGHHSSSSVSNIQHHGIHPLGGISSIGAVNRGISSSSISSLGLGGIHPLGHTGHHSSSSVSTIGHHGIHPLGGSSSIGGIGHSSSLSTIGHVGVGHILPAKAVVSHTSQAYAIPAGYYGGLLTYPQVISNTVATKTLKIPGHAVDAYRGYFAGYYPGSVGYGASYRFFH